eukprot:GHVU01169191.1.p1 GENE.GHVU01169191.1~~GHVU01169191.1.p1  ORF type:complete len:632 (+),score=60.51 GHVU01169191.1:168-2063(+)
MEEPGHKAMLYFLEVLMNSNGPLTISQLAGRFGSRNFSPEMRAASGGNEAGLKKFLLKYPSLFTVTGNMVSLFDGASTKDEPTDESGSIVRSLPDVSQEMGAVQYFQAKLSLKEERWIPIKSLAGHLSQAVLEVRTVVGPQLEFRKFLLKHPHIFEVQGELVGLRDGIAAVATPTLHRRSMEIPPSAAIVTPNLNRRSLDLNGDYWGFSHESNIANQVKMIPPKTPPPTRRAPPKSPGPLRRSNSFSERRALSSFQHNTPQQIPHTSFSFAAPPPVGPVRTMVENVPLSPTLTVPPTTTPIAKRRGAPVTMTANEYKAVMFLKDIIEKRGGIRLHNITGHFSQAPEGVRNTIGWTKMELEEFLKKNANVFAVSEDELVTVNKNAKMNVIITGSRPQGQMTRTLTGRKGKVFHVAKLWGIIDLGKHEHVFFDKSILRKPVDDLQKDFGVGEILSFHAVLAAKTSRAKWRATHVWKEFEQPMIDTGLCSPDSQSALSPSISIEEEINRFLPRESTETFGLDACEKFSDAAPSRAGVVPVWSRSNSFSSGQKLTVMSESYHMNSASLGEYMSEEDEVKEREKKVQFALYQNGEIKVPVTESSSAMGSSLKPRFMDMGCQTIATGDIIATQLYEE